MKLENLAHICKKSKGGCPLDFNVLHILNYYWTWGNFLSIPTLYCSHMQITYHKSTYNVISQKEYLVLRQDSFLFLFSPFNYNSILSCLQLLSLIRKIENSKYFLVAIVIDKSIDDVTFHFINGHMCIYLHKTHGQFQRPHLLAAKIIAWKQQNCSSMNNRRVVAAVPPTLVLELGALLEAEEAPPISLAIFLSKDILPVGNQLPVISSFEFAGICTVSVGLVFMSDATEEAPFVSSPLLYFFV
uniref:Uncharacterized protein n=1 Tax=Glossina brevipalpis TaxID=37001 RepID=A0A1A9WJG4_9MUSC